MWPPDVERLRVKTREGHVPAAGGSRRGPGYPTPQPKHCRRLRAQDRDANVSFKRTAIAPILRAQKPNAKPGRWEGGGQRLLPTLLGDMRSRAQHRNDNALRRMRFKNAKKVAAECQRREEGVPVNAAVRGGRLSAVSFTWCLPTPGGEGYSLLALQGMVPWLHWASPVRLQRGQRARVERRSRAGAPAESGRARSSPTTAL